MIGQKEYNLMVIAQQGPPVFPDEEVELWKVKSEPSKAIQLFVNIELEIK